MRTDSLVAVSTDQELYQVGTQILVTVRNALSVPIFAPRGGCAVVGLLRLDGQQWVDVDSCPAFEVYVVEVAAGTELMGPLANASQPVPASQPVVLGPTGPTASGGDLTKLPTTAPWKSGDPTRIVPEGAVAPPFAASTGLLDPATYRLALTYSEGSVVAAIKTLYSEPFVVVK